MVEQAKKCNMKSVKIKIWIGKTLKAWKKSNRHWKKKKKRKVVKASELALSCACNDARYVIVVHTYALNTIPNSFTSQQIPHTNSKSAQNGPLQEKVI